ncbi:hypothetical protein D3C76_1456590 [compost metagenome]
MVLRFNLHYLSMSVVIALITLLTVYLVQKVMAVNLMVSSRFKKDLSVKVEVLTGQKLLF